MEKGTGKGIQGTELERREEERRGEGLMGREGGVRWALCWVIREEREGKQVKIGIYIYLLENSLPAYLPTYLLTYLEQKLQWLCRLLFV